MKQPKTGGIITDRPIANARMYSVDPVTTRAWRHLLEWVLRHAGVGWDVIDYPAPAPLAALWSREDLGAVFMCGLPYALRVPQPVLIVAPVPTPERYGGRPCYMTDIVVRADSAHQQIEDTFDGVAGYTVTDSQSGYFAFRHFLEPYQARRAAPLYSSVIGDLLNARGVIDALAARRIDVGPLDSYCHDLLRRHQPEYATQVRVIATSAPTPIPGFVATAALAPEVVEVLRAAFVASGSAPGLDATREALLLRGFAIPEPGDYSVLRTRRHALIAVPEVW